MDRVSVRPCFSGLGDVMEVLAFDALLRNLGTSSYKFRHAIVTLYP